MIGLICSHKSRRFIDQFCKVFTFKHCLQRNRLLILDRTRKLQDNTFAEDSSQLLLGILTSNEICPEQNCDNTISERNVINMYAKIKLSQSGQK